MASRTSSWLQKARNSSGGVIGSLNAASAFLAIGWETRLTRPGAAGAGAGYSPALSPEGESFFLDSGWMLRRFLDNDGITAMRWWFS
jgi:hypothetical protein